MWHRSIYTNAMQTSVQMCLHTYPKSHLVIPKITNSEVRKTYSLKLFFISRMCLIYYASQALADIRTVSTPKIPRRGIGACLRFNCGAYPLPFARAGFRNFFACMIQVRFSSHLKFRGVLEAQLNAQRRGAID